jgi:rhomboid family GlyGly-CTERM serine protease
VNLERLKHARPGTWTPPLALALLMTALQCLPADGLHALRYDRAAILAGQAWRLVTGHLVHADFVHLGWNVAGLALVAWLFAREFRLRGWVVILAASTASVDLGFLVFEPQLARYVGFSGLLHGLAAAGVFVWLVRYRDGATAIVAAFLGAKLAWEHVMGPMPFTSQTLALPTIFEAHTYGALGGLLGAAWLEWRRRPGDPSL